jgi:hypothetical protein
VHGAEAGTTLKQYSGGQSAGFWRVSLIFSRCCQWPSRVGLFSPVTAEGWRQLKIELHEMARKLEMLEGKAGCRMPSLSIKKRPKRAYSSDVEILFVPYV